MVDLVSEKFQKASIYQYKLEERSTVAKKNAELQKPSK